MTHLNIILFSFAFIFSTFSKAEVIRSGAYDYPNISGLDATLGTASVGSFGKTPSSGTVKVHVYSGRKRQGSGLRKKNSELRLRIFSPKKKSNQLVFVLAGVGGSHDSQRASMFAAALADSGVYAVTVPSTFFGPFAIYGSRYGYVGDMRLDAADMYTVMKKGLVKIRRDHGIKAKKISVMGYSLGALTAGFLGEIDSRHKAFNFRRVLLVNPVVDMEHAIDKVDTWWSYRREIFPTAKLDAFLKLSPEIKAFQAQPPTIDSFMAFQEILRTMPEKHKKFAIGRSLHQGLLPVIRYAQSWRRRTKNKDPEQFKPKNLIEIVDSGNPVDVSLEQYIRNYTINLSNLYGRPMTFESLSKRSHLYSMARYLGDKNSNAYLLHNADDDWLDGSADVRKLDRIFGSRATIYPRGGHMGNFWYPQNWKKTLQILVER